MIFYRKQALKHLFAEITVDKLVVQGRPPFEAALERDEHGLLTIACRESLANRLKEWSGPQSGKVLIHCGLPLRGVSLRELQIPRVKADETDKLLQFQIEKAFPLPIQELAWLVCKEERAANDSNAWTYSAFAIRKSFLNDYLLLFRQCGWDASFTLSALAYRESVSSSKQTQLCLKPDQGGCDWLILQNGKTVQIGFLPLDLRDGTDREEIIVGHVLQLFKMHGEDLPLSILGRRKDAEKIVNLLEEKTGKSVSFEENSVLHDQEQAFLPVPPGLETVGDGRNESMPASFRFLENLSVKDTSKQNEKWKWASLAAALFVVCMTMPFIGPMMRYSTLNEDYTAIKTQKEALPDIRKELAFLQFLEANRPPYLETIHILSRTAPPNTMIENLSMNRRGDINIRSQMQNGNQVTEFRGKLIESGYFYPVVVDEQSKAQNSDKFQVRISARWKSEEDRKPLPEDWLKPNPISKPAANPKAGRPGPRPR